MFTRGDGEDVRCPGSSRFVTSISAGRLQLLPAPAFLPLTYKVNSLSAAMVQIARTIRAIFRQRDRTAEISRGDGRADGGIAFRKPDPLSRLERRRIRLCRRGRSIRAFQSAGWSKPIVQSAGLLHADGWPASSQTRTFQWQRLCDSNAAPPYSTWIDRSDCTFPESHKSPLSAANVSSSGDENLISGLRQAMRRWHSVGRSFQLRRGFTTSMPRGLTRYSQRKIIRGHACRRGEHWQESQCGKKSESR